MSFADSRLIDGVALWCEALTSRVSNGRPALFCDRDGVIVEEVGYLAKPEDVRLIPAAVSLIRAANEREVRVVVVTNQSGIGRGYFGWADFSAVQDRIIMELARLSAGIDWSSPAGITRMAVAPWRRRRTSGASPVPA